MRKLHTLTSICGLVVSLMLLTVSQSQAAARITSTRAHNPLIHAGPAAAAFPNSVIPSASASSQPQRVRSPAGAPAAFLSRIVRLLTANRYAEAWTSLNPLQQSIAPLGAYVACESQSPIPGRLVSLRILNVRDEPVRVLPELPPVRSTAVSLALRIAGTAVPDGLRIVLTAHAVAVGSRWTWILPPARLQQYRNGCGSESSPNPASIPTR